MRIALITGASSGLGREYARLAAEKGGYDEIWAVARREERLRELADELPVPVRALPLDLSKRESADRMREALSAANADGALEVGLLVNAAGFGKFGTYEDLSSAEIDSMIDLNCRALVDITQVALPFMRRGGRIIQIASSASFMPLPGLNVYAASKAFVRSYTRALRYELRGRGIRVTAVCPLWVKTEFIAVARDTENGQTVRHPFPQLGARRVVRWSWAVNGVGLPIATCCVSGMAMRLAGKLLPSWLLMWAWEGLRRI